jgi:hypothetical protein
MLDTTEPTRVIPLGSGDYTRGGGLPIARWGDLVPVAMLDGSVDSIPIEQLTSDMSRWSPFVTSRN